MSTTMTLPPRLAAWASDDLAAHSRTYRSIRDLWTRARCTWCGHPAPCPARRYALAVLNGQPLPPPVFGDRRDWRTALTGHQTHQAYVPVKRGRPRPHRYR